MGEPKVVEAKYGLYFLIRFLIRMGSALEMGDRYAVILRAIDLSDHPRQIRILKGDWETLREVINKEFGIEEE